ncbi:MAG: radical SAM protein [Pseudobutyrivibrio sp.]|nr:radical SAM protein [Pseudobutyrivibrio sp.]
MNLNVSNEIRRLERNEKVIFLNRLSGKWIKLPKETAKFFDYANENNLNLNQLKGMMYDEEDSEYIDSIASKLKEINFFAYQEDKEHKIDNISYSITHRCNLKCIHCMVNADYGSSSDYFSTNEVIENLDKIIKAKPDSITITGGEPLVRKDFFEISEYLRRNYTGRVGLMTNGTLINASNVERLNNLYDSFDISIDGVNEETCSLIRGKGVFEKVVNSIQYLKKVGAKKISTSMVLTEDNAKYTDEYFALNEELGTRPMLRAMSIYGRAAENKSVLLSEHTKKQSQSVPKNSSNSKFKCCTCTAGYNQLVIEANGEIYPCNMFCQKKYILGNIRDEIEIRKILGNEKTFLSKNLEEFSPDKYKNCKNCDLTWFCWSCLQKMENLTDSEFKERCASQKQLLEAVWG